MPTQHIPGLRQRSVRHHKQKHRTDTHGSHDQQRHGFAKKRMADQKNHRYGEKTTQP